MLTTTHTTASTSSPQDRGEVEGFMHADSSAGEVLAALRFQSAADQRAYRLAFLRGVAHAVWAERASR